LDSAKSDAFWSGSGGRNRHRIQGDIFANIHNHQRLAIGKLLARFSRRRFFALVELSKTSEETGEDSGDSGVFMRSGGGTESGDRLQFAAFEKYAVDWECELAWYWEEVQNVSKERP